MKVINTTDAPAAIGPYSQAIVANNVLYTSGQLPINPETGNIPEDIRGQAEQCCQNVSAILEESGSEFKKVIKTTCFLSDMSYFDAFNEVYRQYFTSNPARSCVAVRELPKGVKCEIEIIALV